MGKRRVQRPPPLYPPIVPLNPFPPCPSPRYGMVEYANEPERGVRFPGLVTRLPRVITIVSIHMYIYGPLSSTLFSLMGGEDEIQPSPFYCPTNPQTQAVYLEPSDSRGT